MSKLISLSSLIRLMLVIGLLAIMFVLVQACQGPKQPLDRFAKGPLKRLTVTDSPPQQPTLEFSGPNEETLRLSDLKGDIVLLNVWATWCAPCLKEMPLLDTLAAQTEGDDFHVITVSIDRTDFEPIKFFKENNIVNLVPWHDDTYSLSAKVVAPGLPVTIFYNRQGHEVGRVFGDVDWTSPEVDNFISYLRGL